MRQRPGDQVGEYGFDDGVAAVGDIGVGNGFGGVGRRSLAHAGCTVAAEAGSWISGCRSRA